MFLPLVTKELAEMAVRPSSFVLRVVFALLLYIPALCVLYSGHPLWADPYAEYSIARADALTGMGVLGTLVFQTSVIALLCAVFLVLPLVAANSIAEEKERGCLELLILTPMSAWQLVRQKYVSRLIPMMTLLLTAMPLFAVAYSYGGTTVNQLLAVAWGTLLTMMLVAAIAMFCSAWCRNTLNAVLTAYLFGPLCYLVAPAVVLLLIRPKGSLELLLFTPYRLLGGDYEWADLAATSIGMLLTTQVFLALARQEMERRLLLPERQSRQSWFRRVDARLAKGTRARSILIPTNGGPVFPDDNPVAWREASRRGLQQPRHLVRLVLAFGVPAVLATVTFMQTIDLPIAYSPYGFLIRAVWFLCGTILLMQAATIIPSERSNQTWDILLSTPLPSASVVQGKLTALRRLQCVLALPMLVILAPLWPGVRMGFHSRIDDLQFTAAVLGSCLALEYTLWIGFTCGTLFRSRKAAVVAAATASLVLFAGTRIVADGIQQTAFAGGVALRQESLAAHVLLFIRNLSPLSVVETFLGPDYTSDICAAPVTWILCLAFVVASLHSMRRVCVGSASRILRKERDGG